MCNTYKWETIINICRKTFQTKSKFRGRVIKSYFAWCKVLRSNITVNRDKYYELYNFVRARKNLGVSQYRKAKLTAALTEGYLHSLLWQEKRHITTHLVNPQEIRRFYFFLQNEYSKAFVFDWFLRNRLKKLHMVCWTGMYNNLPRQVLFWSTNLFYFVLI